MIGGLMENKLNKQMKKINRVVIDNIKVEAAELEKSMTSKIEREIDRIIIEKRKFRGDKERVNQESE